MYVCMYVYKHTNTHKNICMYIYVCIYVLDLWSYIYIHVYTCEAIYLYVCVYICVVVSEKLQASLSMEVFAAYTLLSHTLHTLKGTCEPAGEQPDIYTLLYIHEGTCSHYLYTWRDLFYMSGWRAARHIYTTLYTLLYIHYSIYITLYTILYINYSI